MANIYIPDDSESENEEDGALSVSSGRQSAVLIESDGSEEEEEEIIDVEAVSQQLSNNVPQVEAAMFTC